MSLNMKAARAVAVESDKPDDNEPKTCPRCKSAWVVEMNPDAMSLFGREWYCKACGLIWSPGIMGYPF